MAVPAADLDRFPHLRVELAVAVGVTGPVAVDALHALVEVDVLEVHGALEALGIAVGHDLVVAVQQPSVAVALVDADEMPAMPVLVAELHLLHVAVVGEEVGHLRGAVGREIDVVRRIHAQVLLVGIPPRIAHSELDHAIVVGLLVPQQVALVHRERAVPLMVVARHALRRGDAPGELMLDGVAGLVLGNGLVARERKALVAVLRHVGGVGRLAVVGVEHVTARAAALPEVAGDVVRALQPQTRIVEPGLQQRDVHAGHLEVRSLGPVAGADVAALEDPEGIPGHRDLPPRERDQLLESPVGGVLRRQRPETADAGRHVHGPVALLHRREGFPVHRDLRGLHAVVVESRVIDHGIGRHDRPPRVVHDAPVAVATRLVGDPKVGRVHELDEFRRFHVQRAIGGTRIRRALPEVPIAGQDVGPLLGRLGAVAAVALGAGELDRLVHRLDPGMARLARGAGRRRRGLGGRRLGGRRLGGGRRVDRRARERARDHQ